MTDQKKLHLYTDGACLGNPGPGGWAYILRDGDCEVEGSGGSAGTTNQRMEVTAVLRALESIESPASIEIWSDSKYVTDGLTQWMDGWIQKGWKTASKKPVANQDLWQPLSVLHESFKIRTHWIRGHTGHPENERCDTLASAVALRYQNS